MVCMIAVSYTHLEEEATVQFLAVILIQVNHDEEQDKISDGFVEPVSYTHLDVYKRQA